MILAIWENGCWELRYIPSRGRTPHIVTRDAIVFSKKEDAIKELVTKRQQPICMTAISQLAKRTTPCYFTFKR
jgi:hypothetical protein